MDNSYFINLLNKREIKATSSRLDLLNKMSGYKTAMPYSAIQTAMKKTDRVTLYRTLETLNEKGIIHKAFQENNEVYYALCGDQCESNNHLHDHVHFRCTNCKSVTCQKLINKVNISLPNYEIQDVSIHIRGRCQSCIE